MKDNPFSLHGKVAIVTGALGLLGKQHCQALADAGANVVVSDLDGDACCIFASKLSTNSIGVRLDVTKPQSIQLLLDLTLEKFEQIDILVNNAAVNDMFENPSLANEESRFEKYPLVMWQKMLDVNITGVFLCSQLIGAQMAKKCNGSIINIASTYGLVAPNQSLYRSPDGRQPFFKSPAYPTTKGAVIAFSRYLAAYWGHVQVRVNTLSPGGVQNGQDDFFITNYSNLTPLGRMAKRDDYKGALVFLASDASAYMTGANLVVDGGWTVW